MPFTWLHRLASVALAALPGVSAVAAPFAYVPLSGDVTLAVIDTADNSVQARIPTCNSPGVAVSPNGSRVYVMCQTINKVFVVDTATRTVIAMVPVDPAPFTAVVSPDGNRVYVTTLTSNRINVIDAATNTVTDRYDSGPQPLGIAIAPDGSRLYVGNSGNGRLAVIDVATHALTSIAVGSATQMVAASNDGRRVYTANLALGSVSVVDTATNTLVGPAISLGGRPMGLALSDDDTRLYVSDYIGAKLWVIDTASRGVIATPATGRSPQGMDLTPDGTRLFVANADGAVDVFDTDTLQLTTSLPLVIGTNRTIWGIGTMMAQTAAPRAPTLAAATHGNRTATLVFAPPVFGGSATITRYTADCGGTTVDGTASPLVIGGLTNGNTYTCTVTATSADGTSAPSNALAVTPSTLPAAPTITALTPGDGAVTASVEAPVDDGGAAVTSYAVTCGTFTANGASPVIVTGLTNGEPVTCTAQAVNLNGPGPASAPWPGTVTPGIAPQFATTTLPNARIRVAYSYTVATAAIPAAAFSVSAGELPPGMTLAPDGSITGTPALATSPPGDYIAMLEATNSLGTASGVFTLTVEPNVPAAPAIVAVGGGNRSVIVSFGTPTDNGGRPILSYAATCGSRTGFATTTPVVVDGLTNGVAVTCTVAAVNTVGQGDASAPSASVTPGNTPGAPTLTSALGGDAQIALAFDAPAQDGGVAVDSYTASCTPGSVRATGSASPLTVTGLVNGTTYSCSVVAVNPIGTGDASNALAATPRAPVDLSVTVDNGSRFIPGGTRAQWLVKVTNAGPNAVTGARVTDGVDVALPDLAWACAGTLGGTCPASGAGAIDVGVNLPAGASVSFLVDATVPIAPEAPVTHRATVTEPASARDTNPTDNEAVDGPDPVGIFADGFD